MVINRVSNDLVGGWHAVATNASPRGSMSVLGLRCGELSYAIGSQSCEQWSGKSLACCCYRRIAQTFDVCSCGCDVEGCHTEFRTLPWLAFLVPKICASGFLSFTFLILVPYICVKWPNAGSCLISHLFHSSLHTHRWTCSVISIGQVLGPRCYIYVLQASGTRWPLISIDRFENMCAILWHQSCTC